MILIEILPVYEPANAARLTRQEEVEAILLSLDYTLHRILKDEHGQLKSLEQVSAIGIHSSLELCDYVAIPRGMAVPELRP